MNDRSTRKRERDGTRVKSRGTDGGEHIEERKRKKAEERRGWSGARAYVERESR